MVSQGPGCKGERERGQGELLCDGRGQPYGCARLLTGALMGGHVDTVCWQHPPVHFSAAW
jgi:hypothetical protein